METKTGSGKRRGVVLTEDNRPLVLPILLFFSTELPLLNVIDSIISTCTNKPELMGSRTSKGLDRVGRLNPSAEVEQNEGAGRVAHCIG